jgi:hypothetical protein
MTERDRRARQGQTGNDIPWTMSVPAAGRKYYGKGKNESYAMAHAGQMPCIKVGSRGLRALPRVIEAQLSGKA